MVPPDLRARCHHQLELVRHEFLLAGGIALVARNRRSDNVEPSADLCPVRVGQAATCRTHRRTGVVLALCRYGLGSCAVSGVLYRAVAGNYGVAHLDQGHKTAEQPTSVVLPAPTAWPFVFAVGVALIFSGLLTNVSVSLLGFVLWIMGAVGWFLQVLPHEHHEEVPVVPEAAPVAVAQPEPEVVRLEVA